MIKPTANSERYYGSEEPFFLARSGYFTPHRRIAVIPGISEGEYNQILALRSDGRIFCRDWAHRNDPWFEVEKVPNT